MKPSANIYTVLAAAKRLGLRQIEAPRETKLERRKTPGGQAYHEIAEARRALAIRLAAEGVSVPEIARRMDLTVATIKNYIAEPKAPRVEQPQQAPSEVCDICGRPVRPRPVRGILMDDVVCSTSCANVAHDRRVKGEK